MPNPRTLSVHRLDPRAKLPSRSHDNAIGLDVHAFLLTESGRPTTRAIHQKGVTAVPTGLVVIPPPGHYIQCCSRSGLAQKGIIVANAPGIIDPDYSGELIILLFNGSWETHYVSHEHRIAQLVLAPIVGCDVTELSTLPSPQGRGAKGFGSTGL
jgi:dUTP pyrophosphatase